MCVFCAAFQSISPGRVFSWTFALRQGEPGCPNLARLPPPLCVGTALESMRDNHICVGTATDCHACRISWTRNQTACYAYLGRWGWAESCARLARGMPIALAESFSAIVRRILIPLKVHTRRATADVRQDSTAAWALQNVLKGVRSVRPIIIVLVGCTRCLARHTLSATLAHWFASVSRAISTTSSGSARNVCQASGVQAGD